MWYKNGRLLLTWRTAPPQNHATWGRSLDKSGCLNKSGSYNAPTRAFLRVRSQPGLCHAAHSRQWYERVDPTQSLLFVA
jgi:hypothetical protein